MAVSSERTEAEAVASRATSSVPPTPSGPPDSPDSPDLPGLPEPGASPKADGGATALDSPGSSGSPFGQLGRPLRRTSPFYIGFVGALGVLLAWLLGRALVNASQVIVLLVIALFLAVGLNGIAERVQHTGLSRRASVTIVAVGVLLVFVGFIAAVVPPLVSQVTQFLATAPDSLAKLQTNPGLQRLDQDYGIVDRLREVLTSDKLTQNLFGGVIGVGRLVLGSLLSVLTVLILTLYFLASLPSMKHHAYQLVPRSRRTRVTLLGDEILLRIGGYVLGQLLVATCAAATTLLLTEIIALPYPLLLALVVGMLDLIPMIGATLGAVIVTATALTESPTKAVISLAFFVLYQQIENYLIYPRVMRQSVDVPPAMIVVAALVGGGLLGVFGAMLAIPTAAALLLITREVVLPRQDRL